MLKKRCFCPPDQQIHNRNSNNTPLRDPPNVSSDFIFGQPEVNTDTHFNGFYGSSPIVPAPNTDDW